MQVKKKKISTILPKELLSEAARLTKANQTDTIVLALKELIRSHKRSSIFGLKGRLRIHFDIEKDRERDRF